MKLVRLSNRVINLHAIGHVVWNEEELKVYFWGQPNEDRLVLTGEDAQDLLVQILKAHDQGLSDDDADRCSYVV